MAFTGAGVGAGCFFGFGAGRRMDTGDLLGAGVGAGEGASAFGLAGSPPNKENLGVVVVDFIGGAGAGVGATGGALPAGRETGRGVNGSGAGARPEKEKPGDEFDDEVDLELFVPVRGPVPEVKRLLPTFFAGGDTGDGDGAPVPKRDWKGAGPFGVGTRLGAGGAGLGTGVRTGARCTWRRGGVGGRETARGFARGVGAGRFGAGLGAEETTPSKKEGRRATFFSGAGFTGALASLLDLTAPKEKGRLGRACALLGAGTDFCALGVDSLRGAFGATLGVSGSSEPPPREKDGIDGKENGESAFESSLRFTSLKKKLGLSTSTSSSLSSSLLRRFLPGGRLIFGAGAGVGAFAFPGPSLNNELKPPKVSGFDPVDFSVLAFDVTLRGVGAEGARDLESSTTAVGLGWLKMFPRLMDGREGVGAGVDSEAFISSAVIRGRSEAFIFGAAGTSSASSRGFGGGGGTAFGFLSPVAKVAFGAGGGAPNTFDFKASKMPSALGVSTTALAKVTVFFSVGASSAFLAGGAGGTGVAGAFATTLAGAAGAAGVFAATLAGTAGTFATTLAGVGGLSAALIGGALGASLLGSSGLGV